MCMQNQTIFSFQQTINYVIRYTGRPTMAQYSKKQIPFTNEIKAMKDALKKSIDEIPNKDFLHLVSFLMFNFKEIEDDDWTFDEELEDKAEKFYNQENNNSNNDNLINEHNLPL